MDITQKARIEQLLDKMETKGDKLTIIYLEDGDVQCYFSEGYRLKPVDNS